ncbi:MAG: hypothetical protein JXO72_14945 [Vicinamibacteria bacterium]|nr:hypothetical protein [Vicinamibacteria bacterium]
MALHLKVRFLRETDGRWIADVPRIPGISAYGATRSEAYAAVQKLALEVIADRIDRGEDVRTGRPRKRAKVATLSPLQLEITPLRAVAR